MKTGSNYNEPVELLRPVFDAEMEQVESWQTMGLYWVHIDSFQANAHSQMQTQRSETRYRLRMRAPCPLRPGWRMKTQNALWEVEAVSSTLQQRGDILVLAIEREVRAI
ncbi:head-tail adaptor protein [Polycladidibacter stylochi]|uniref:phage head completion protein n=1 Tax=Polycladidibacter stylochi TaxID=1807766 RepID=UPI00082F073E|nr:head-tail adaptor protein [Pseudovibrio stylochi]